MTKEEITFHYQVGSIIACDISKQYFGAAYTNYREAGNSYLANKCRDAEQANEKLLNALSRDLKAIEGPVKEVVEHNMEIIYGVLALPHEKQKRVLGLINKLK